MLSCLGPMSFMLYLGCAGGVPRGPNPLRFSPIGASSCLFIVLVLAAHLTLSWKGKPLTAEIGLPLLGLIGDPLLWIGRRVGIVCWMFLLL